MKNKKGFTLIELIVVIAILGILALFLVPQFMGYANDAKLQVARANTRTVWSAAKAVEVSYQYKYTEFDEAVFKADVMDKLGTSFDADEVSVAFDGNYMVSDVAYKTGDYTCETANGTDFVCTDK